MSTGYQLLDSALETGNYTLALKLTDKKISQQPSSSYHRACRCYVLANASLDPESKITSKEALDESVKLLSDTPSDPKTLILLELSFELLNYKPKDDLFELAIRKYQSNNLAYEWFKRTVDKNDIVGMQKATMLLSKAFKSDTDNGRMIKLWSAAVIVVLIECCKDQNRLSNGKDKLLSILGLKIVENVETDSKKGLDAQELYVKCHLLLKKGDVEECLKVLKKFLSKESDLELRLMYFDLLEKNENWSELYESCVDYLVNVGVDDWDTWKLAILAAQKSNEVDNISKIIENYSVGRNSQLAKIKVLNPLDSQAIQKSIENYLSLYMHKLCCFLDLKSFLSENILPKEILLDILKLKFAENELPLVLSGDKKATEKDLILLVNYIKIKTFITPESFENKEFFTECCKYYEVTKHLQNKLADFDYYAGFEFLILAIQSYLTISANRTNPQSYFNLIIILENALRKNKYEFHLQLWLAHCYSNTNLTAPLTRIFEALQIKNVQIDTLFPHFNNHLSTKTHSDGLLSTAYKFYNNNVPAELPPMMMSCFEHSTFSKLKGFFDFKTRIENSTTNYHTILQMIQNTRLGKNINTSINTITSRYIPVLRNAYQKIVLNGVDVDLKIHDNSDRTIIWDCGDHKVHKIPQQFVESEYSCLANVEYVELLVLFELTIYDQHNRAWDEYKEKFLIAMESIEQIEAVTEPEKLVLINFAKLLLDDTDNFEISFGEEPSNPLSAGFNNYYFTLQDFERILSTVIKQSSETTFFGKKDKKSQVNAINAQVKKFCRAIKRDELLIETRKRITTSKQDALAWFKEDEFGKQFHVPEDVINTCYKIIEQDALKAVKEI